MPAETKNSIYIGGGNRLSVRPQRYLEAKRDSENIQIVAKTQHISATTIMQDDNTSLSYSDRERWCKHSRFSRKKHIFHTVLVYDTCFYIDSYLQASPPPPKCLCATYRNFNRFTVGQVWNCQAFIRSSSDFFADFFGTNKLLRHIRDPVMSHRLKAAPCQQS